jgi:hypothetical protein
MLTSSRTRQAYLRVLVFVAVGVAAVAVLLNIPVAQAYFATGALGVLTSFFFFCAPFTVRGRLRHPGFVLLSVVAFALLFWTLLGPILFLSRLPMSSSMSGLLKSIRWILAGLTLGVLLSLNLSGQLAAWSRKE